MRVPILSLQITVVHLRVSIASRLILYQTVLVDHPLGGQGQTDRHRGDNVLRHVRHDDADQQHDRVDRNVVHCYGYAEERNPLKDSPARDYFHKTMNLFGERRNSR